MLPLSPTRNIACPPSWDCTALANTPGQSADTDRSIGLSTLPSLGSGATESLDACPVCWLCAAQLNSVSMLAPVAAFCSCSTMALVSVASGVPSAKGPLLTDGLESVVRNV